MKKLSNEAAIICAAILFAAVLVSSVFLGTRAFISSQRRHQEDAVEWKSRDAGDWTFGPYIVPITRNGDVHARVARDGDNVLLMLYDTKNGNAKWTEMSKHDAIDLSRQLLRESAK